MAWRLRVHTLIEFRHKPDTEDDVLQQMHQVIKYMRMILHAQPNRRFIFGLLLSGSNFHIFLGDRTGLLYTTLPIDIHKVSWITSDSWCDHRLRSFLESYWTHYSDRSLFTPLA